MNRNRKWTLLNDGLQLLVATDRGFWTLRRHKAETIDWHVQNIFASRVTSQCYSFRRMPELIEHATNGRLKIIEAKG
jgi:hypothetical protein